jgi:hypothetical protein
MWHDEIVEEIRSIRERYAQSFNYDLKKIFADLQKKQTEGGRKVVSLPPKDGITARWSRQGKGAGSKAEETSRRST